MVLAQGYSRPIGYSAVGEGRNLFCAGEISGEARWFLAPADVVSAREDELRNVIALVLRGGMTFLSPVLSSVGAVVCMNGSLEAPLALLARELEVPCVMAARLGQEITDGEELLLDLRDPSVARILRPRFALDDRRTCQPMGDVA